jgi:hypothetical protein
VTGITDGFAFLPKIDKITIINMTTRRIIIIMHKDGVNKTLISNLVRTTRFWNNLHQVRSSSKDWNPNNLTFWEQ